ncbi:uncharacterized protein LOC117181472 [Belonocnema kinseyi]|uniref:uncharacterized protein LOC117181472 n=1 Tax=Belonocnema kinseyi TaxID=2817044 RepID=UPI00143D1327|nr:uncharacterized protein LOC117181472 [Belonocnema kinseyi]
MPQDSQQARRQGATTSWNNSTARQPSGPSSQLTKGAQQDPQRNEVQTQEEHNLQNPEIPTSSNEISTLEKKKRGRPKKILDSKEEIKRKRGRPKKDNSKKFNILKENKNQETFEDEDSDPDFSKNNIHESLYKNFSTSEESSEEEYEGFNYENPLSNRNNNCNETKEILSESEEEIFSNKDKPTRTVNNEKHPHSRKSSIDR